MKKLISFLMLSFFITVNLNAQSVLTGVVRDLQNNQPIPSAIIKIVGGTETGTTNDDGMFRINYSSNFSKILVSAIGYQGREISVADKTKELLVLLESTNLSTSEIQVEGYLNNRKNIETPGSIGLLSKQDLNRTNGINIQNAVNLIPGVDMQFRTIGAGSRMIIRGYGNQTNFNGIGYKAYYNDVPLTDADGSTVLDDVDFTNLTNVEVYKGPSSSIYGTGIAGVLNMRSDKAPLGTNIIQRGLAGSYGLWRTNTGIGTGTDKYNIFGNYGHQNYSGFRTHSASNEDFALMNGNVYIDNRNTLSFFGNYSYTFNELAGELDSASFYNNASLADSNYIKNDAHIRNESSRLTVSYEHIFSPLFVNKTSFFTGFFFNDQPSAAGLTRANRSKYGARTTFSFTPMLGKMRSNFVFGGEFFKNVNFAQSYALTNNVLGALRGDQEIKPMTYNVFGQADVNITPTTLFTVGSSINFIEYTVNDMIAQSSTHVNMSGYKRFDPIITPRVAINQTINDMVSFYGSLSTGYSPPSTSQVLITQLGKVNYNLEPEKALSIEFGSKGSLLNRNLNYQLAAFQMNVTNKLVTQNFAAANGVPAYSITTNAGEVRYRGFEVALSYAYVPTTLQFITLVRPFATYTYSDFTNVDFKSNNNNDSATKNYNGLKVPGVAPNVFNAGLDVETQPGIYTNLTFMFRDKTPLTFDNVNNAKAFSLFNAKLGLRRSIAQNIYIDVYAGADNIFGETYYQQLFLNVNDKRFYISGPNKATFYGGLSFQYTIN
ncbi:MAG TPA: TonB-dependent receptor [Ignavibacteria bacterium]|nr:TonB-dependent receptor [Ignavibacteria bacterium]